MKRGLDGYPAGTDFLTVRGSWAAGVQGLEEIKVLFLFVIRRCSPRVRAIIGVTLTLAGLVLLGAALTVASWLVVHGILVTAVGIAFGVAYLASKRAQATEEPVAQDQSASPVGR